MYKIKLAICILIGIVIFANSSTMAASAVKKKISAKAVKIYKDPVKPMIMPTPPNKLPNNFQPNYIAPPLTRETIVARSSEIKRVPAQIKTFQYGLFGGYLAGLPAVLAEVRFSDAPGQKTKSLRFGGGLAVGSDSNNVQRKHALVLLEGIYHFDPLYTLGVNSYLGVGFNYDVYTTNRTSGSVGGQFYFGLENGTISSGQLFAEIGYGIIRTGFSPSNRGLTLMFGARL